MFAKKTQRPEIGAHDAVEGKKRHLEEVNKGLEKSDNAANVEDPEPHRETKLELSRMLDQKNRERENGVRGSRTWRTARHGRDDNRSLICFISHV
jgi:hypothetical protein